MHQQWVPTSFNAVCVYPLRIVENGSTLTTEMGPLSPIPFPSHLGQALLRSCDRYLRWRIHRSGGSDPASVRSPAPPTPHVNLLRSCSKPQLGSFALDRQGNPQGPVRRDFEQRTYRADLPPLSSDRSLPSP